MGFALDMIQHNPALQDNPNAREMIDAIRGGDNGLCDGFYATANGMNTGFAAVQNALCQGFSGVTQAVTSQGYESRLGTQALQAQLAQCCCDMQAAIQANTTQGVMNTNAIRQQVA